jgi:hypothetical protein
MEELTQLVKKVTLTLHTLELPLLLPPLELLKLTKTQELPISLTHHRDVLVNHVLQEDMKKLSLIHKLTLLLEEVSLLLLLPQLTKRLTSLLTSLLEFLSHLKVISTDKEEDSLISLLLDLTFLSQVEDNSKELVVLLALPLSLLELSLSSMITSSLNLENL